MIQLLALLVVIGVLLYLVNNYIPMAASIKTIVNVVVVVGACLLVLRAAGLVPMSFGRL
jgi:hypothetical protein